MSECRGEGVKGCTSAEASERWSEGAGSEGAGKRESGKVRKRSEPRKSKGVNFAPHTYNVFDAGSGPDPESNSAWLLATKR